MSEVAQHSRLFVGSLADETSEDDLRELFATVGPVRDVSIIRDWNTGRSRGFGFVQMEHDADAAVAIERCHGHELHGRRIRVVVAEPRGERAGPDVEVVRKADAGDAATPRSTSAPTVEPEAAPTSGSEPEPADDEPADQPTVTRVATPAPAAPRAAAPDATLPAADPAPGRRIGLSVAVVGLIAVAAALVAFFASQRPAARQLDPHTVLVLPLDVVGQPGETGYLGHAFAQAVAVNLATVGALKVLPLPSPDAPRSSSPEARGEQARQAGAGHLLTGTLTRQQDRVHAALTLVDSVDNRLVWGTQREGRDSEVLALAAGLAAEVAVQLGAVAPRRYAYITDLAAGPELSAEPALAEAVGALRRGEFGAAATATEQLVARYPDDATALALRAHALVMVWDAEPSPGNLSRLHSAIAALERQGDGRPYVEFDRAYMEFKEGRAGDAIARLSAVLDRDPLAPAARAWLLRYRAIARQVSGDLDGALGDLDESLRLDPTNAWTLGILSSALVDAGRLDEALTRARQGLALVPSYWRSHQALAHALAAAGKRDEAADAYGKACQLGKVQLPCTLHVVTLQKAGRDEEARQAAEAAAQLTPTPLGLYNLACYWALAGDRARALPLLQRALQLGLVYTAVATDPDLASLRGDPAFEALIQETAAPAAGTLSPQPQETP